MFRNATLRPLWNFLVRLAATRPVRVPRWALIVTFQVRPSLKATRTRCTCGPAALTPTCCGVGGRPTAPAAPEPAGTESCSGPAIGPSAGAGVARTFTVVFGAGAVRASAEEWVGLGGLLVTSPGPPGGGPVGSGASKEAAKTPGSPAAAPFRCAEVAVMAVG